MIFIDATNGNLLGSRTLLNFELSPISKSEGSLSPKQFFGEGPGLANTAYSGQQTITNEETSPGNFRLREQGKNIRTLNMLNKGGDNNNATDYTNNSSTWNYSGLDQYGLDAHWAAEKTWDFYFVKFNRQGLNGANLLVTNYVNVDLTQKGFANSINAYWLYPDMVYGYGSSTVTPLTGVDIVGHEMTHGVTEFSSQLAYDRESGALNESFSDMMGAAIEYYAKPGSANCLIGENSITLRDMANPHNYFQPDTYGESGYWNDVTNCTPTKFNDKCYVHSNSGVGNKWFYLMTAGGSGTNGINNT